MQAISKIIISNDVATFNKSTGIIGKKCKNIRKFTNYNKFMKFMGCSCNNLVGTTTTRRVIKKRSIKGTIMGRLQQHQRVVSVVGVINRMLGAQNSQLIHW